MQGQVLQNIQRAEEKRTQEMGSLTQETEKELKFDIQEKKQEFLVD